MKNRLIGFCIGITSFLVAVSVSGQIVVTSETQIAGLNSPQIAIEGNFINNSTVADLSKATLVLLGSGQTLTNDSGSPIALGGLVIDGGGTKTIGGAWEVAGPITFNNGIVVPSGADGKIVHTSANGVTDILMNNSDASHVNGIFHSKGSGIRLFPVGNNSGYFPAQLANVTQADLEVGMRVVNNNAAFTHPAEITEVFTGQYWELIDPSSSFVGAKVAVSTLGAASFLDANVGTVLIGGPAVGGAGISLGGTTADDLMIGETAITANERVFTIAKITSDQIDVKIHNVITPYLDNANDYLQIDNIQLMTAVKVRLLDRWGVQVREWSGFQNVSNSAPLDPSYDLSKLNTGNYICILEYTNGSVREQQSQMITLINQ